MKKPTKLIRTEIPDNIVDQVERLQRDMFRLQVAATAATVAGNGDATSLTLDSEDGPLAFEIVQINGVWYINLNEVE